MKWLLTLFVISSFLFVGCAGEKDSASESEELPLSDNLSTAKGAEAFPVEYVETTDVEGYTEKYSRRKTDFSKEGKYVKFSPEGVVMEEAHYHNDSLDGKRILFFETGDTSVIENYVMNSYEGQYIVFYKEGPVQVVGQYEDNKGVGEWKKFYPSGGLMEVVTYTNSQENGPFVEYYENGNMKAEGTYKNGDSEQGELKIYNEDGILIKRMDCNLGVCKTIWEIEEANPSI